MHGGPPRQNLKPNAKPAANKPRQNAKPEPKKFSSPHYEQAMIDRLEGEIIDHSTKVRFDDIADLEEAKKILKEAAILPMIKPNLFKGIRRPWKGILLTGPPGTGKSLLAKALATECEATFFGISSSSLASKWKGDSEQLVKLLFEMAAFYAPSIIFIDEVDSLCSKRSGSDDSSDSSRRVKSEILVRMDGFGSSDETKRVLVLGATNFPWDLDEAFRRRLEKRIYIPLPTARGRRQMLDINLKDCDLDRDVDLNLLAHKLENFSGADITNICRDAAMMGMRNLLLGADLKDIKAMQTVDLKKPITMEDFQMALDNIHSSVCTEDVNKIEKWIAEFGSS